MSANLAKQILANPSAYTTQQVMAALKFMANQWGAR